MRLYFFYLFYFLCLTFPFAVKAQNQEEAMQFEHLSVRQGLSQGIVNGIVQDAKGFIWIGTEDELNRYDGYDFLHYESSSNSKLSLPDNWIRALATDHNGDVWIGTDTKGIARYNRQKDIFETYQQNTNIANSLISNYIACLFVDSKNMLWIGTKDAGLCSFDIQQKKFTHYTHETDKANSIADNNIKTIFEDKNGTLWIGTNSSLSKFNQNDGTFINYTARNTTGITDFEIRSLLQDNKGLLWIGTGNNGLYKFDIEKNIFYNYSYLDNKNTIYHLLNKAGINDLHQDKQGAIWVATTQGGVVIRQEVATVLENKVPKQRSVETFTIFKNSPSDIYSLSNNHIKVIFEDAEGGIWLGTDGGGVNYFNPNRKIFKHYKHDAENPNTISNNTIRAIYEDKEGILWVGAIESGLDKVDRRNNTVKNYRFKDGLVGSTVSCIFEDYEGYLWVGTHGGGLNRLDKKTNQFIVFQHDTKNPLSINSNSIEAIREDANKNLWIATDKGFCKMDKKNKTFLRYEYQADNPNALPSNAIQSNAFLIDKGSNIWIGTYGGGLTKFDISTQQFYNYTQQPKDENSLCDNRVIALFEDSKGKIWIGTHGGGLCMLSPIDNKFTHFSTENGLAHNEVYGILGDDKGNIWISTKDGLSKYNPATYVFRNYHETDGLQSNIFYWGAAFKSRSGELFFGGTNGLNAFFPNQIKDNTYVPPVVLTKFEILNRIVPIRDDSLHKDSPLLENITDCKKIELSYTFNSIAFEFTALNYMLPQKNQYFYKLENFDEDWIPVDAKKRFAAYSNLPYGDYVFKVKASNNDAAWNNEGVSIKIQIVPPIWKTLPFQTVAALVILAVLYALYRWRINTIREQQDLLEQRIEEATLEIKTKSEVLEAQKQEIFAQKENIQSSIKYAQRIQEAMLPLIEDFSKALPASFVLFKPRDIVSGDFYWLFHTPQITLVAAADCTGHGVPGAFMSMIGHEILNEITEFKGIFEPHLILEELNIGVRKALRQDTTNNKDGMDISICAIDRKERMLSFAGALNPLYYIQDDELKEIKGNKYGIGGKQDEEKRIFTKHTILLDKPSVFYIFSDGYQDQFGGENNSKFMPKRLKKLFLDIHRLPMTEQKQILDDTMKDWIKNTRQIDDILIIGFKI